MSTLMQGKRGLIMGVANDHSIAWGIARTLHQHGAQLAFTYQGDHIRKRLHPLVQSIDSDFIIPCDVSVDSNIEKAFATLSQTWPTIDFIVHAIAYANKDELQGRFVDTTLEGFHTAMHISCYSFISVMRRAEKMMSEHGGSALTLSYIGAQRVIPNYNVMGVAKAALEASTRYLASDLGKKKIRVNAVSAGPMRTLAGAVIGSARDTYKRAADLAPLGANPQLDDIGGAALYLLSDLSKSVSGEVHFVDGGFHAMGIG